MKKNTEKFDFQYYVEKIKNSKDAATISEFQRIYGTLEGKNIEDLSFYQNYLTKFDISLLLQRVNLKVPEELTNYFDYDMLFRLTIASFSSEYELVYDSSDKTFRLLITVTSGRGAEKQSASKYLDDLWVFQIERLFDIYLTEQMNLSILKEENDVQNQTIDDERKTRLHYFQTQTKCLLDSKAEYDEMQTVYEH